MAISRYLENVFLGADRGPASWLIRALLWPLSLVYQLGLAVYLWIYNIGLRRRCKLGVPVISVGNLTCGGTGKTPAVQTICRMLQSQERKVVILSRGHGGSASGPTVASDGESVLCDSSQVGDEPILLARSLPGIPIVVGKDRRASGKLAIDRFAPDVIVLDDGLQYWQLRRDLDVVVLNALRPFGSGFVFPMGDLREPKRGLRRAGVVLLTGTGSLSDSQLDPVRAVVNRLAPGAPAFAANHRPVCIREAASDAEREPDWISDRKVFAFCGIGRPDSFLALLRSLDASIAGNIVFADHYRLSDRDITAIIDGAAACDAEVIITTEKDLARLDERRIPNLHTLAVKLEIENESDFAQYIANRINR